MEGKSAILLAVLQVIYFIGVITNASFLSGSFAKIIYVRHFYRPESRHFSRDKAHITLL